MTNTDEYAKNMAEQQSSRFLPYDWGQLIALSGLTITELAERANISRPTVYNIKNGKTIPDTKTLTTIANVLTEALGQKVDVSFLIAIQSQQKIEMPAEEAHSLAPRKPGGKSHGHEQEKAKFKHLIEKALQLSEILHISMKDIAEFLIHLRKYFLFRFVRNRDYSTFICDVTYPDDSIVYPNQIFTKKWSIQNSGIVPWEGRKLVCIDEEAIVCNRSSEGTQNELRPDRFYHAAIYNVLKPTKREVLIPDTLPGEPVTIEVEFQAPPLPCTAISYWKMYKDDGSLALKNQTGLYCRVKVIQLQVHTIKL